MADDRRRLFEKAELAARRGELSLSAQIYRQLLEQTPNDLVLLQRLGDALARSRQEPEAREIFRRLASDYWKGGFRSRAVAALRRAIRLGEPDRELLQELGERILDIGLVADALQPLQEAAEKALTADDPGTARDIFRRLIEVLPRDLSLREALTNLEDRHGTPAGRSAARAGLAVARGLNSDPEGAVLELAQALKADGQDLSALEHLPEILMNLSSLPESSLPETYPDLEDRPAFGWTLMRTALRVRAGATPDPTPLIQMAQNPETLPPKSILWTGRILLDAGQLDPAARALVWAAEHLASDPSARVMLTESLSGLLARDPGRQEAMTWLMTISGQAKAGPPAEPEETPIETEEPSGRAAEPDLDAPAILPPDIQAKLLEAETLLQHGLRDSARETWIGIGSDFQDHPQVRSMDQRLGFTKKTEIRGTPPPQTSPPPQTGPPAATPRGPAEDDLFVILEGETGPQPPSVPPPPPQPTTITSPVDIWSERTQKPDLDDLQRRIQEAIPEQDVETEYQMGIGLLEMGLEDQAIPMLERALSGIERRGDAALTLVRLYRGRGDRAKACPLARSIVEDPAGVTPGVRAELLSLLGEMVREEGDEAGAQVIEGQLAELVMEHPEVLEFLSGRRPS